MSAASLLLLSRVSAVHGGLVEFPGTLGLPQRRDCALLTCGHHCLSLATARRCANPLVEFGPLDAPLPVVHEGGELARARAFARAPVGRCGRAPPGTPTRTARASMPPVLPKPVGMRITRFRQVA